MKKTELNWMQKYHLLDSMSGWTPILEPPDPDYAERVRRAFLDQEKEAGELSEVAAKRTRQPAEWRFSVEGLGVFHPKRGVFGTDMMTSGPSPEAAVNEFWEMTVGDLCEGQSLVAGWDEDCDAATERSVEHDLIEFDPAGAEFRPIPRTDPAPSAATVEAERDHVASLHGTDHVAIRAAHSWYVDDETRHGWHPREWTLWSGGSSSSIGVSEEKK